MEIVNDPKPPTGLSAFLFRLPIHLYRLRIGWLFGGRLLHLTHTGRVSGKKREVVIEVVGREDGCYFVCSGFGERANWYRNVLNTPEVSIQVGTRKTAARAVPLTADDGAEIMEKYAKRHPRAARKLCRYMGFAVDGSAADFREVGRHVPFLKLTPTP